MIRFNTIGGGDDDVGDADDDVGDDDGDVAVVACCSFGSRKDGPPETVLHTRANKGRSSPDWGE